MPMRKTIWLPFLMAWTWTLAGQPARHVDDSVLKSAAKTGEEWLTYGQNAGETRYSPLAQIDAKNVARLGLAWSYDIGKGGGNQEATPLVWNGALFSITNWSVVFALDARTGKERWRWDPEVNQCSRKSAAAL
jgi:quinohemoprotein ethanol dehydrogenase